MKKLIVLLILAALFTSCMRDCGCGIDEEAPVETIIPE